MNRTCHFKFRSRAILCRCAAFAAVIVLIATSRAVADEAANKPNARPNILFIMSDDHGSQALSCYGSKVNQTPNLDRIAKTGMRFDRCFVTNSICGPSRAVILTGKYSHLNGFATNTDRFDGSQPTVATILQKAGYQTAVIGKWHLASTPVGFDHYHILEGQGPYYNPRMLTPQGPVKHVGYTTDIITDEALSWLKEERQSDRPFFLMLHHKAPHRNWMPAPRHFQKYDEVVLPEPATLFDDYAGRGSAARSQEMTIERHLTDHDLKLAPQRELNEEQRQQWDAYYEPANRAFREAKLEGRDLVRWKYQRYAKDYLRCIDAVDEGVGHVLDYLDESGLAENTVVIYTSDQGWYLGEHGWYDKRWMYEESLRTPLLVRWPGRTASGSTCEAMTMNLDFASTFLEVAGEPVPEDMQGQSLAPLLAGETPADWRRSIYYHYYEFPGPHSVAKHRGVRTERYKLIEFYELGEWELYDLQDDPEELKNIFADPAQAKNVEELKRELERLRVAFKDIDR
jgi:arylsulfatase A-like enzyme